MNQTRVIDADGHITESDDQVREYMEAPYCNRQVGIYISDAWDRSLYGTLGTRGKDAETWLNTMDAGGLEKAILYPTSGLAHGWIREPDFAVATAKAYNNFLSEKFLKASPRLNGVALVPLQDVPEAVKELRRAVTELKLVGAMLPAVGLRKPLGHPDYWPVYEEAERLGTVLAIHATVRGPQYFAADLFDHFIDVHTLSHSFAQMMQMTNIIFRGVLDTFPKLKIAFMEAGCTWVPYWVGRMDEEWEHRGGVEAPLCKQKPSDHIKSGRIFISVETEEELLPQAAAFLGEDVLLYASDWPHWDHGYPDNIRTLEAREDVSPELKQKILYDNATRLYGDFS